MSAGLTHKDCRVACQEQDSDCGAKNTVQKEGRESHPDRLFADKKEARRELKELAQGFAADYLAKTSQAVCEKILRSEIFSRSQVIFGYLAFAGEISVDRVLQEALRLGKTVAVPRIISRTEMQAAQLTSMQNLPLDRYGIRTAPEPVKLIEPAALDLLLVPGTGFTLAGCRMGRGAGYYDRFLPRTEGFTLGVTCDLLVRDFLPCGPQDCKVSALVTEFRLLSCLAEQKRRETVLK